MSKPAVTNFMHALVAVLAGNALYFLAMPYLPAWAQHNSYREDTGIVVDFGICLVIFLLVKTLAGPRRRASSSSLK